MSKAALLSVRPPYVERILAKEKRLEFRRVWVMKSISHVMIYATVPVQRIVAIAEISKVYEGSPTHLWRLAQKYGGGISRNELYTYFKGKKTGYALKLGNILSCDPPIDPTHIFVGFRAPQSYYYLERKIVRRIEKMISSQSGSNELARDRT